MAFETVESIEAHIARLEEQKKLIGQRDEQVDKVLAVLKHFEQVLTAVQRRRIARVIGAVVQDEEAAPARQGKRGASKKGRKLGKVAPRYQIPGGATWSGRGRMPTVFTAWSDTAEGKAWHKANPDEKYPAVAGMGTTAKKKATKKGAAKKGTKKAAKKRTRAA